MSEYRLPRNRSFGLKCPNPNCGKKIQQTIGRLESKASFTCPHCKHVVRTNNVSAFKEHEKAINDFRRRLRKMFKQ